MTVTIFLVSLCGAMALGMPIAFALIVCAVCLMLWLGVFDTQIIAQNMIIGADSFQLLAIPFFLLAGELMNAGGLSKRIVNFALSLVGHLHGGLGYVAIFAAIIMASLSGSAAADTAALASILLPMMRSAGYDVGRSGRADRLGRHHRADHSALHRLHRLRRRRQPLDHPAVPCRRLPGPADRAVAGDRLVDRRRARTRWRCCRAGPGRSGWKATWDGSLALLMPVAILGGIRFGIVTPTEAAVVATVYALIVGMFVYRELKPQDLYKVMLLAAKTTSAVMLLVAAAVVSAWLITQANIPAELSVLLEPFMGNKTVLMFIIMLLVMIVGTALDFTPTVLILTPVLMPIVKQAGIDPIYFGVLFIINNAIGLITPPVGIVLNVVCGVARVPMSAVMRGVWPFFIAQIDSRCFCSCCSHSS